MLPDETVVVRTTMQPDLDLQVTAREAHSLNRQGLLVPGFDGTEYTGVVPEARIKKTPKEGN
jgi:hypothetical protein